MAMWETPRLLRLGVSADILVDLASSCQRAMLCGGYGHRHGIDLEVPSVVLLRPGSFVAIVALCWMNSVRRMEGLDTGPSPKGRGDEKSDHFVLFMYASTLRPYVTVGQNLCCSLAGAHRLVP